MEEAIVTADVNEFCEEYSMNYEQTDVLKDINGNCHWMSADGKVLKAKLIGGSSQEVSTWIYLNLK